MNKKTLIGIAGVAAIILLAAVAFAVSRPATNNTQTDTAVDQPLNSKETSSPEPSEVVDMPIASITYTDTGFSPTSISLKVGTVLTVNNESTMDLMFASADHPTHTINTEINLDTIKPGASDSVTITKAGTWGYHNHDMADHTGQLIVTE